MNNKPFILTALYIFFFSIGSIYGFEEKIISFGSAFSWELMEKRQGVAEASLVRPYPVLVLDGTAGLAAGNHNEENSPDLYLSFDEGRPGSFSDAMGRYNISVSPKLASVSAPWSRRGKGAALFNANAGLGVYEKMLVLKPGKTARFAPGRHVRSFSIEF